MGAAGVPQCGGQQGLPAARQSLAHDAKGGLGLHGEVQPHRAGRALDRAAEPESAPPLRVGLRPLRYPCPRFGEDVLQRIAGGQPGEGLVSAQGGRLPGAAASGEQRERPERDDGAAVRGEGVEPEFADEGTCGAGRARRRRSRRYGGDHSHERTVRTAVGGEPFRPHGLPTIEVRPPR